MGDGRPAETSASLRGTGPKTFVLPDRATMSGALAFGMTATAFDMSPSLRGMTATAFDINGTAMNIEPGRHDDGRGGNELGRGRHGLGWPDVHLQRGDVHDGRAHHELRAHLSGSPSRS